MHISVKAFKKYLLTVFISFNIFCGVVLILLYGPFFGMKSFLITTSMTTMRHQWIATLFYSENDIYKVLLENAVIQPADETKTELVKVDPSDLSTEDVLYRSSNEPFNMIPIERDGFKGFLVAIYEPSKIKLGVTKSLSGTGELVSESSKDAGAVLAMNASGFVDVDGHGNGGIPTGIVVQNGKIIFNKEPKNAYHNLIGFNDKGILTLSKCLASEIEAKKIIEAVEFGPFLIVNGIPAITKGNGGWGVAPRTAIGQREDGIVLFLVIDGRQTHSIGATMIDVIDIMTEYGAINAANLDGGSSSVLVIDGKIINKPCSSAGERHIPTWFMLMN